MIETDLLLLSLLVFLPGIAGLLLLLIPRGKDEWARWAALFATAATLVVSACVFIDYYAILDSESDPSGRPFYSFNTTLEGRANRAAANLHAAVPGPRDSRDCLARVSWVSRFHIDYYLGVDGISLPLILLSTALFFLAALASWGIEKHVKGFFALLLFLETCVLGSFVALDFVLFYVFYELMLLPMFFLIGVWGGPRREYAAMKFFLYTLAGGVLILGGLLFCYFTDVRDFVDPGIVAAQREELAANNPGLTPAQVDERLRVNSFDLVVLAKAGRAALQIGHGAEPATERQKQSFFTRGGQYLLFALFFLGFAVKIPLVPLHHWLPDAHVEAPTPVSMLLAGVLLKLGGYGLLRVAYPIAPWAAEQLATAVGILAVIAIVYGAFLALGQTDFKKLLAYSSISHMGYVVLGIAVWAAGDRSGYWAWGVNGAMFQMVAHGISSAALFFVVGVVYDRAHHRDLNQFRGLMEPMPLYTGLSMVMFFASMGLPGLCGFVGELLVMLAAWNYHPALAIPAILTTVLTAAYLLWTIQRVYFGTNPATKDYPDLSLREVLCLVPFAVFALALGVLPGTLLMNWMDPSVTALVESLAKQ